MKKKSSMTKMRKHQLKADQEMRRARARQVDVVRLQKACWLARHPIIAFFYAWFGRRPFDWNCRYDNAYVLKWARDNGWNGSRLLTAMETVDNAMRIQTNFKQRRIDQMKRRAVAFAKWNAKQKGKLNEKN